MRLKIYYHTPKYISYLKTATAYQQALKNCSEQQVLNNSQLEGAEPFELELVTSPELADLAILHDEPQNFAALLQNNPALNKIPKIAYAVWETDLLPEQFRAGLNLCDAIWTCSEFSRTALLQSGKEVTLIPHIVERTTPSQAALKKVLNILYPNGQSGESKKDFFFYSIVDAINPRKNLKALLKAFYAPSNNWAKNVKLVLKQYRVPHDFENKRIINITEDLFEPEMAALHSLCHCYVSAHCSEGWGLGLSEAMSFGKPVVATGYSGNLSFMNANNSFLVAYKLGFIPQTACDILPFVTPAMQWAEVDENDLALKMQEAFKQSSPQLNPSTRENILAIRNTFSAQAVGRLMYSALENFVENNIERFK